MSKPRICWENMKKKPTKNKLILFSSFPNIIVRLPLQFKIKIFDSSQAEKNSSYIYTYCYEEIGKNRMKTSPMLFPRISP